ncbi:MAG: mechanosensitive ion channel [Granulosicoccus sp.]|nr:mechanosensitive ion channel [Granulosicoccus sp.]
METDQIFSGALDAVQNLASDAYAWGFYYFRVLTREWSLYQIGLTVAVFLAATLLAAYLKPRYHAWLHAREGWSKGRLRLMLMIHRRMRMIIFVALIWTVYFVMQEVTWPSRYYLIAIFANLSIAWLVVIFATRLIHNALLRMVVRFGALILVVLSILDLTESARNILDSIAITIADVRLSLWTLSQALVALTVLITVARILARASEARIRSIEDISPSMQILAIKILQLVLYCAAFFIGLKAVGVDLTGLAVLSGAIGIGIGFGLQKVVSNLVSGVIILMDRSIKPGDVISLGETFGWVESLGARYVSITTRDGKEYLIPNEDLITGQVVNWSHSNQFVRLDIFFGAAYSNDPHEVRRISVEAATSCTRVLNHIPPVCHIVGFGDSSVDYILRFWISDPTKGLTNIRGNVYLALWDAFQEHGIIIPFPQREVRVLSESGPFPPVHSKMASDDN